MAVTDTKTPYEILIRFGLDGLPTGAHCQYLRRVVLDGEVLKEEIEPAEPLDLSGFPTSDIMSDAARDALARVTTLEAEKAELIQNLIDAEAELADGERRLAAATARIEALEAHVAERAQSLQSHSPEPQNAT